jgi:cyclopropane-fatty-acyl-phospholipid synthase
MRNAFVQDRRQSTSVAETLGPVARALLGGEPPVRIRCWDGSSLGPSGGPELVVASPRALRQLVWAPPQLGLARALLAGDVRVEGDVVQLLESLLGAISERAVSAPRLGLRDWLSIVRAAARLGALGPPEPAPPEEARLRGRVHSRHRDADAVAHHYDVSNDFYRLFLGSTMTYSCAYWAPDVETLDDAQVAKYELVSRKLGLAPGMRLLDVGCGWGGMAIHAASRHGCSVVGVTVSENQAELARKLVADAGIADNVEIRLQDYRDIGADTFDAISSIGMFEHVGLEQLDEYFSVLLRRLRPGGRLLNHGIARPKPGGRPDRHSFVIRYIFPDAELREVGEVITAMERGGFEVRDLECLREHYGRTLRAWVAGLQASWEQAVTAVGERRALIWLVYLAGCAVSFERGDTTVHQILAVRRDHGRSHLLASRQELLGWQPPENAVSAPV